MSANFDPTMGNYKNMSPFKMWCQKVLPLTYDDSLSYYEVLCKLKNLLNDIIENMDVLHDDVDALHTAYQQLEGYVNSYFDNLSVQTEINNKLDAMAESGELGELISPFVASGLPSVVSDQIGDVVSSQIGGAVGDQIGGTVSEQLPAEVAEQVPSMVTSWLNDHVNPESEVVIDDSLSIEGAAADAKATGDAISELNSSMTKVNTILNISEYPKSDSVTTANGDATDFPKLTGLSFEGGRSYTITYSINRQASSKAYFYVKDSEGHNLFTGRQIAVGDTEGTWSHTFTENDITGCYAQMLCTDYPITGSITISETVPDDNAIERIDDNIDEIEANVSHLTKLTYPLKKLNGRFNAIAYSKVIDEGNTGNINTKENFLWCAKRSEFPTIKADMRLTSDGKIVLCHDAGYTLNQAGDIVTYNSQNMTPIHDLTLSQCLALKFASTGLHPCDLDTVVKICKMYGKFLFITLRNEYVSDTLTMLFATLDKYNFRDHTIINNFTADMDTLGAVRAIDKDILICYTSPAGSVITTSLVDNAIELGNCIYCGTGFGSATQSVADVLTGKEDAIAYATQHGIPVYMATVYNGEFIEDLLNFGVTGCQIGVLPIYD